MDVFQGIDEIIITWILDRLLDENLNIKVNNLSLVDICKSRKFKHFKDLYSDKYDVLINAYYLILNKDLSLKRI